jgi:hypothetical protein
VLDSDSAYLYIKTEFLELVLTDWCLWWLRSASAARYEPNLVDGVQTSFF